MILPTQDHGDISTCLCHLWFLSLVSYNFLCRVLFLLKYVYSYIFYSFFAIVDGIDYLISLSDFSLLVYRNANDFCVLTLYPATLLNSLISSSNFLILFTGHSMNSIMSSANSDSFTFFSDLNSFYVFVFSDFCSLGLPELCWIMVGKVGIPCLVPDLRGNAFSFLPLRIMFAVDLSYMGFIMLR